MPGAGLGFQWPHFAAEACGYSSGTSAGGFFKITDGLIANRIIKIKKKVVGELIQNPHNGSFFSR